MTSKTARSSLDMLRAVFALAAVFFTHGADEPLHLKNWTQVSNFIPLDGYTSGAVSPNGTVVIVAYNNYIFASTNRADWTIVRAPVETVLRTCVYIGGRFIIGGGINIETTSHSLFAHSEDGYDWEFDIQNGEGKSGIRSIVGGNGELIAGTDADFLFRSADGITWIRDAEPLRFSVYNLAFGNGVFVSLGISPSSFRVWVSTDGITWTLRPGPSTGSPIGVWFGNGVFVSAIPGTLPLNLWSRDGATWNIGKPFPHYGSFGGLVSITFANDRFFATTYDRRFAHSFNGIDWTIVGEPVFPEGYQTEPQPVVLTAGNGHAFVGGAGIFMSPEFTTLVPSITVPWDLLIHGRTGSRHHLQSLNQQNGRWENLREVQIGPEGRALLQNWLPTPAPGILRTRSVE